jgi:hypothetical protein
VFLDPETIARAKLTPDQVNALRAQEAVTTFQPYFSTVGFFAPRVGAGPGPYTYTIPAGKRAAFGYAQNDPMETVAGIPVAVLPAATDTETNIAERSKSNNGEAVFAKGIRVQPHPSSDPEVLRWLWSNVAVRLQTKGTGEGYLLGPLHRFGGGAGLYGSNATVLRAEGLQGQAANPVGMVTNGIPYATNFIPIPEGIVWQPQGSDSNWRIIFDLLRPFTVAGLTDRAAIAAAAATGFSGVTEYLYPGHLFALLYVELVGTTVAQRSAIT